MAKPKRQPQSGTMSLSNKSTYIWPTFEHQQFQLNNDREEFEQLDDTFEIEPFNHEIGNPVQHSEHSRFWPYQENFIPDNRGDIDAFGPFQFLEVLDGNECSFDTIGMHFSLDQNLRGSIAENSFPPFSKTGRQLSSQQWQRWALLDPNFNV